MSVNQYSIDTVSSNSSDMGTNMSSVRQTNMQQTFTPTYTPNSSNSNETTSDNNSTYVNLPHQTPSIENFTYDYGFREPLLPTYSWMSPEQATWVFNLPVFGRIRVVKDLVGMIAMTTVVVYWFWNVCVHVFHILYPAYQLQLIRPGIIIGYVMVGLLALFSMIRSSIKNPGALNTHATPDASWNTCQKCNKPRPPDTHHCRRCGQCVRKMDHHCPWINNCVGEDNRFVFMLFLIYSTIMAVITTTLDVVLLYSYMPCVGCHHRSYLGLGMIGVLKLSFVSSFLLTIGGAGLIISQHMSIVFQMPTMEMTRLQIQMLFHQKFPDKLPEMTTDLRESYREVCGSGWWLWWGVPCRKWCRHHGKQDIFRV